MDLLSAALVFTTQLMDRTYGPDYDRKTMSDVVEAIVNTTHDLHEVETLIKIARWETGGFRRDIVTCKVKGDHGLARGIFQVHPFNAQEYKDTCSDDYTKQVAVALVHVHDSEAACKRRGLKGHNLLTIYTHGRCHVSRDGVAQSHWGDGKALQALVWTEAKQDLQKVKE